MMPLRAPGPRGRRIVDGPDGGWRARLGADIPKEIAMTSDQRAPRDGGTTEAASDRQVEQMVSDPAGYFARSRQEAKREARGYVAKRLIPRRFRAPKAA